MTTKLGKDIQINLGAVDTDYKGRILGIALNEDGDDFATVEGEPCLVQDLFDELWTMYFDWAIDFTVGTRLPLFVNMPDTEIEQVDLGKAVIEPLIRDARIVPDSWDVTMTDTGAACSFLPISREKPPKISLIRSF